MKAGTALSGERFSFKRAQRWLSVVLVAASFFIYAAAALIVQHQQKSDFIPERSSIAAAVSNVVYRARHAQGQSDERLLLFAWLAFRYHAQGITEAVSTRTPIRGASLALEQSM
jgi:hypothetical protein